MGDNEKDNLIHQLKIAFGEIGLGNLEMVDYDSYNVDLFHISLNPKIYRFIPRFSQKTIAGETQSIARVSTCPSILGCILGYGDIGTENNGDYLLSSYGAKKEDNRLIYTIYQLPYRYAVRPNKKLLPDVEYTNEHWLIASSVSSREYTPNISGQFFLKTIETDIRATQNSRNYRLYLKLNSPVSIIDGTVLQRGCYEVYLTDYRQPFTVFKLDSNLFIKGISEQEYLFQYTLRTK